MHHRYVLSPFLLTFVVDVTEMVWKCVLCEVLLTAE